MLKVNLKTLISYLMIFILKMISVFFRTDVSKITQLELTFEKLENFFSMIKENYHIILEDNTERKYKT